MRSVVFALAGMLSAAPLLAQEVAPPAGRYAISASEQGFIRLDTETGAMAHCDNQDGVWRCDPLGGDASIANRRLLLLAEQVAELSRAIGRLAGDLDALQVRMESSAPAEQLAVRSEDDARGRRETPGFAEQVMGRLFELVREIKREEADRG